jgi:hypothetical protein
MAIRQQLQDIRDGWVRIEAQSLELLRENPNSTTGRDALEQARSALGKVTSEVKP